MSCCRSDLLRRLAPTYRFLFWSMLASVFLRYSVFRYDAYASFCFLGICRLHRAGVVDLAIVSAASEHSAFVQVLPCVSGTHSLCATEVIKLWNSDTVFSVLQFLALGQFCYKGICVNQCGLLVQCSPFRQFIKSVDVNLRLAEYIQYHGDSFIRGRCQYLCYLYGSLDIQFFHSTCSSLLDGMLCDLCLVRFSTSGEFTVHGSRVDTDCHRHLIYCFALCVQCFDFLSVLESDALVRFSRSLIGCHCSPPPLFLGKKINAPE
nr:MAG TPA: hypothetical protein [Caudoviricetes sp.]